MLVTLTLSVLVAAKAAPREVISSPDAPHAIGPYVQAIETNGMVFVSGQLPLDPTTGKLVSNDIRDQTKQVLQNLSAILASAHLTLDDVVTAHVYVTNLDDFGTVNEAYARAFSSPPARVTVQVARLPKDAQIEIALIAVHSSEQR